MCQPDLNLYTYSWRHGRYDPHANDKVDHMCIDWDEFENWLDNRKFSETAGLLVKEDGEYRLICLVFEYPIR